MLNVCNTYSYSSVTTVSTETYTMRDTHVTLVNDENPHPDTLTRYAYLQKKSTIWTGLKIPSLVRVSRSVSGYGKDTSLRRVVAENQLRCLRQSQDYPARQTEARESQTEDFLDWFDKAWDQAEIWKFDDTWREFDDSWGRYTEQRLLLRVR